MLLSREVRVTRGVGDKDVDQPIFIKTNAQLYVMVKTVDRKFGLL
jgi:hypothetical protein